MLNANCCSKITEAGIARLKGIKDLSMMCTFDITDAGLAYLRGIHKLRIGGGGFYITDAGLAHLRGIHTLILRSDAITDAGLRTSAGSTRCR